MFDENVREETVCCLRAAAGSFNLKKNEYHPSQLREISMGLCLLIGAGDTVVSFLMRSASTLCLNPLGSWVIFFKCLSRLSIAIWSSSADNLSGTEKLSEKILYICRKINRIYRHDHPTLNLDLLHLASVPSYPHPEYLRSSTPSQPDRNQSRGPHHRCKAFLIGSSLLNGREEVFSWLLSGKSPQDWPGNGQIRIERSHTNCRPISKESGMMNSPFVRIFMHLWRFDQTAVNEEFYQGTLSQAWKISKLISSQSLKQTVGEILIAEEDFILNYNLQPDGHWSLCRCGWRVPHCSLSSLPILRAAGACHLDDDASLRPCHLHGQLTPMPESPIWSCQAQFYYGGRGHHQNKFI